MRRVEYVCGRSHTRDEGVARRKSTPARIPVNISEITFTAGNRVSTNDHELNRVLGGGMIPGSVVLIGGEPGIGNPP